MPLRLGTPPIEFNFFREQDGPRSHPRVEIMPEKGVIIGGGARVYKEDGSGPDNMLTALYPQQDGGPVSSWVATSKDHGHESEAILEAWCVTADIDAEDVYVGRAAGTAETGVAVTWAQLPKEYELVAGGARAFFEEPGNYNVGYAGALLLASSPLLSGTLMPYGWYASATDHLITSPVAVEAYAIGINRDVLREHKLLVVSDNELGAVANHPSAERTLERWISPDRSNGVVVGGGVEYEPRSPQGGNFLTSSWPITDWSNPIGWRGSSQDHDVPSPRALQVTAFAIIDES